MSLTLEKLSLAFWPTMVTKLLRASISYLQFITCRKSTKSETLKLAVLAE
jgi:hypothetical protein